MKSAREKMKCPQCGVDMNHHADKIDYSVRSDSKEPSDGPFGGRIQEFHACPKCGGSGVRRVRR